MPSNQLANRSLSRPDTPEPVLSEVINLTTLRKHHHRAFQRGMTEGRLAALRYAGFPRWFDYHVHDPPHNPIGAKVVYLENVVPRHTIAFNMTNVDLLLLDAPLIEPLPGVIGVMKGYPITLDITEKVLETDNIYLTLVSACNKIAHLPVHNCANTWHDHHLGTSFKPNADPLPPREQPAFFIREDSSLGQVTYLTTDHFQHIAHIKPRENAKRILITFTCSSSVQEPTNARFLLIAYGTTSAKPFNNIHHLQIRAPGDPRHLQEPLTGLAEHRVHLTRLYGFLKDEAGVSTNVQNYRLTPALKIAIDVSPAIAKVITRRRPQHRLGDLQHYCCALSNRTPITFCPSPHVYTSGGFIAIHTEEAIYFRTPFVTGPALEGSRIFISVENTILHGGGNASTHHRLDGDTESLNLLTPYTVIPDPDQYDIKALYISPYLVMCLTLKAPFQRFGLRFTKVDPQAFFPNRHLRIAADLPNCHHAHQTSLIRPINKTEDSASDFSDTPPPSPSKTLEARASRSVRPAPVTNFRPPRSQSATSIQNSEDLFASQQIPSSPDFEPPQIHFPLFYPLAGSAVIAPRPQPRPSTSKLSRSYKKPAETIVTMEPVITKVDKAELEMIPHAHSDDPELLFLDPEKLQEMLSESDDEEQMIKIPKHFTIKQENDLRLFLKLYHQNAKQNLDLGMAIAMCNVIFNLCDQAMIFHPDMHQASDLPTFFNQPSRHSIFSWYPSDSLDYDCQRLLMARNRPIIARIARKPIPGDLFYLSIERSADAQQHGLNIMTCNKELHPLSRDDLPPAAPHAAQRPPVFPMPSSKYHIMRRTLKNGHMMYGISPKEDMTELELRAVCTGAQIHGYMATWLYHIFGRLGGVVINETHLFTTLEPSQIRPMNSRPPPQLDVDDEYQGDPNGPSLPRRLLEGRPAPPPRQHQEEPIPRPQPHLLQRARLEYIVARAQEMQHMSASTLDLHTAEIQTNISKDIPSDQAGPSGVTVRRPDPSKSFP